MLDATTTNPDIAVAAARMTIEAAIAGCITWDAVNAVLPPIRRQYPMLSIWGLGAITVGKHGYIAICDRMHNVLDDVPCPNAKPGPSTW